MLKVRKPKPFTLDIDIFIDIDILKHGVFASSS